MKPSHVPSQPSIEVMVWISNTEDFPNWPAEKKLVRYERVVEWHEYIRDLASKGKITHAWGSHQLLSRAKFTTSQGVLIAIYNVASWAEFDELLLDDPLRDLSQYTTTPLTGVLEDRDTDLERYERHKRMFLGDKNDPIRMRVYDEYRAQYNNPPEYVGKYNFMKPDNPGTAMDYERQPGDPLQILVLGVNPEEYVSMWDDARKLIHHEKVMWWHDYAAMLLQKSKISHAWGTNDFCHISSLSENACGAPLIYSVESYEEFDQLYKLDPLRDSTSFWTVLLQPIADQRRLDRKKLEVARQKLGVGTQSSSSQRSSGRVRAEIAHG